MEPQPQCLSEVEFDKLVNDAAETDSNKFNNLMDFCRKPICQPIQYLRVLPIIYDRLGANKIPNCAMAADPLLDVLDTATTSMFGLATTLPFQLNQQHPRRELVNSLCTHWPDIRQWVLFLYRNIIVREDLNIHLRIISKLAVLEFLGLTHNNHLRAWSKSIPADQEVMKVVCGLWLFEIQDPQLSSCDEAMANQRESAVFNECLIMAFKLGIPIDWDNILSVSHGDPNLIARVSLSRLEGEISHEDKLDLHCITCDLQLVSALAQQKDICLALLQHGMVSATCDCLALIVDREWKGDELSVAALCTINAIALLRSRIEEMDALPFVLCALEHGLVASLLKCEALLTCLEEPSARQEPLLLLGVILPGYSVYRSVLHQLTPAVDMTTGRELYAKLPKSGEFYRAWKRLRDTVNERRRLVKRDISSRHVQTCQNDTCLKTSHISRFKRCGGCLHAYYCSWECQRYDWQHGKHKEYCMRIHQRFARTHGQMSPIHCKDLKFLDQVILAELNKHRERLSARRFKHTIVELNLVGGQANVVFVTDGAITNPFGTKCQCESLSNARWKRMVGVVREERKPLVLVRAFIPGGMSRKIVLQAIPLTVVVGWGQEQRRNGQEADKYQCNLVFSCCGSAKDDPLVMVESGFPRNPFY